MYPKFIEKILYIISMIFLGGSIYAYIFVNDDFTWISLFGTDGLTFFGLVIALVTMLAIKIPLIKRGIGWILLRLNYSQIDYRSEAIIILPAETNIDDIKRALTTSLSNSNLFKHNTKDINQNTDFTHSIYHRGMAANIIIKKTVPSQILEQTDESTPSNNFWKIEVNGGNVFHRMEKNIKFFVNNFLEQLSIENAILDKINLTISNENTEYNLSDKGILINPRKYKIRYSSVEITSSPNTTISINSTSGLSITSRNKGEFSNAMDALRNILIS
ncbi:hypothetical protein [Bacillus sp. Cr_A10]|uniref:hypothetical protein n=1 Tax=Bacillus sp. Cr_A10 TaxID=3033993 RepID=UPI0023D97DBD|nr:hypothetical protein [Bacillus sp. Cr_A10]MDF2065555.1 hypothetical protein [Bacillus sp. Cr_A10]